MGSISLSSGNGKGTNVQRTNGYPEGGIYTNRDYNELLKRNLSKAGKMAEKMEEVEAAYLAGQISGMLAMRSGFAALEEKGLAAVRTDKPANDRTA